MTTPCGPVVYFSQNGTCPGKVSSQARDNADWANVLTYSIANMKFVRKHLNICKSTVEVSGLHCVIAKKRRGIECMILKPKPIGIVLKLCFWSEILANLLY